MGMMNNDILKTNIAEMGLKNPVLVSSGTFGYAEEYKELFDVNKLGGIITKTITLKPKKGNASPRIMETPCGVINSIGLQNPGVDDFIKNKMPKLKEIDTAIIVSIGGSDTEEFEEIVRRLEKVRGIDGLEINLSCPNIISELVTGFTEESNLLIAQDAYLTFEKVRAVRKLTKRTIIPKLSPNVTDMVSIARSCYDAGADAISIANTYSAMAIDIKTRKPFLGNIIGGLSGPAIKPLTLKFVWEVSQTIDLPIIASGGIMNYKDALEFIIAGARAVAVGTGNIIDPKLSVEIIKEIEKYLNENNISSIKDLEGAIET